MNFWKLGRRNNPASHQKIVMSLLASGMQVEGDVDFFGERVLLFTLFWVKYA